ncbi:hypothetical protein PIB30_014473 [Stylosanthes scabra]|uniref:Secreted protein n=1 Tax=Stylosanthes scabra TaxID=79078 RepID=A0ABU6WAB1_9FABA|nr:hypothetical protein [Stylosanthes scabra]
MGALLFLISALLSRGLDLVQSDRDDPSLPLVTAPFGKSFWILTRVLEAPKFARPLFNVEQCIRQEP